MQITPGVRLRSFEVVGPLGAGGMGAVYRAHDRKLDRDVAIKILQDELSSSPEHLQRFKREARAASALNHPNIITIFEIDECDGKPFIAMELVEGRSLRDALRHGRLATRTLLDIATQIADGLAAAHDGGIVHRDLKPENVMITSDGRVKIVDFGLARARQRLTVSPDDITSTFETAEQGVAGTPAYMSPEQIRGDREVDYHSDQFAFGSILYELATGRRAFQRNSRAETFAAVLRDEPESIELLNSSLPESLCWLVRRCLAKEPWNRYAATSDLARELRAIRDGFSQGLSPRLLRRRSVIAAALTLGVSISVGAVVDSMRHWPAASSALPSTHRLAVLPFTDETGSAGGELFSVGLGEAVRQRLDSYDGMHLVGGTIRTMPGRGGFLRIAQDVGATLLLHGTVKRIEGTLHVKYSLIDPYSGKTVASRVLTGSVDDVWRLRDQIAASVALNTGLRVDPAVRAKPAGLRTDHEQELYVRALGALERLDGKATERAIADLHELLETAPDSPFVSAALGRAFYNMYSLTYDAQWVQRAERSSRRALELDPESPDTLTTLGTIESIRGNYRESIAAFRHALTLRPNSSLAALGLAQTLCVDKQYDASQRMFARAIELQPAWWLPYNQLGSLYWTRGRYADALREYRKVIQLNPQAGWGYTNSGAVLMTTGRIEEAIPMFRKAAQLDDQPVAHVNLGDSLFLSGRYDEAVQSMQTAVRLGDAASAHWVYLGDACSWSPKHRGQARDAYRTAIERARVELATNPKNARAYGSLAIARARTGDLRGAQQSIRRALELAPENPEYFYRAARVANLAGMRAEAIVWLARALAANSSRLEIERHPEFAELRKSEAVRKLLAKSPPM